PGAASRRASARRTAARPSRGRRRAGPADRRSGPRGTGRWRRPTPRAGTARGSGRRSCAAAAPPAPVRRAAGPRTGASPKGCPREHRRRRGGTRNPHRGRGAGLRVPARARGDERRPGPERRLSSGGPPGSRLAMMLMRPFVLAAVCCTLPALSAQTDEAAFHGKAAEKLNAFATRCFKGNYPSRARAIWLEILKEYDTDNEVARKSLG